MQLTAAHLAPFAGEARTRFARRLTALLRAHFPDAAGVPLAALRDQVHAQVAHAATLGLTAEAHAAQYVIAAWVFGAEFEQHFSEAGRVLRAGAYRPADAADWLREWTRQMLAGVMED